MFTVPSALISSSVRNTSLPTAAALPDAAEPEAAEEEDALPPQAESRAAVETAPRPSRKARREILLIFMVVTPFLSFPYKNLSMICDIISQHQTKRFNVEMGCCAFLTALQPHQR